MEVIKGIKINQNLKISLISRIHKFTNKMKKTINHKKKVQITKSKIKTDQLLQFQIKLIMTQNNNHKLLMLIKILRMQIKKNPRPIKENHQRVMTRINQLQLLQQGQTKLNLNYHRLFKEMVLNKKQKQHRFKQVIHLHPLLQQKKQ